MKSITKIFILSFLVIVGVFNGNVFPQQVDTGNPSPSVKTIELNLNSSDYQELFHGPPGSYVMHSGLVTLEPGGITERHNSEDYEEIIIVFEGEGQLNLDSGETFEIKYGTIAYCPPETEHSIINNGEGALKYLYVAAKTNL